MGHQPVGGPGGTLEQLGGALARVVFTHLNNSNPMLDPTRRLTRAFETPVPRLRTTGWS